MEPSPFQLAERFGCGNYQSSRRDLPQHIDPDDERSVRKEFWLIFDLEVYLDYRDHRTCAYQPTRHLEQPSLKDVVGGVVFR